MKPEEQDELKENDLASWLQFGLWNFLKQNGSYLLLAVALAFLGYQLWSLHKQKQTQQLWTALADLHAAEQEGTPAKMLDVVDKYKQPEVQTQGYMYLGFLYDQMIADPGWLKRENLTRNEALDKAMENYQAALAAGGSDPLIGGWAHMGIAAVDEDKGDWDKARAEYQTVVDHAGGGGTPMVNFARQRLANLEAREDSPRLASMIPPPAPENPSPPPPLNMTPGGAGPTFPGIFDSTLGGSGGTNVFQENPTSTAPGTSTGLPGLSPFSPMGPFLAPTVGGGAAETQPGGGSGTAPAGGGAVVPPLPTTMPATGK